MFQSPLIRDRLQVPLVTLRGKQGFVAALEEELVGSFGLKTRRSRSTFR